MKYLKKFTTELLNEDWIDSSDFVYPYVSLVTQTNKIHYISQSQTSTTYTFSNVTYSPTVLASATNTIISWDYTMTVTSRSGRQTTTTGSDSETIEFEQNFTTSSKTITGSVVRYNSSINYSFVQQAYAEVLDEIPLTFDVLTTGTILWKKNGSIERTISYSKDNGSTWTEITSTAEGTVINVNSGDKVLVKGNNTKYSSDKDNYSGFNGGTATYNIKGNIMSLINGNSFTELTSIADYAFCSLFKQSKVVSASNLILPILSLHDYCYRAMFSKAPNLIAAPELPATTISKGSYWYMFEECPITEAPDLLADNLPEGAYGHMFTNCSSLTQIKCLAISKHNTATEGWVTGVASSGTFVQASGATWTTGVNGIPSNWTVTTDSNQS